MSTRNSNYGLSYVLEGTTASEEQQQRNARAKVAGQLGISLEEFEQQLRGKDINPPEAPIDSLLRVTVPAAKLYEPADAPVKDKFGNTPAQKAAMIHKQITRRPTDDEIEAKQFRAAYKDKTGKKMLSYVDDMSKKYDGVVYDENGYPDRASPSQYGRMAENMERMRQMTGTVKRDSKTDFKLNTAAFESANPKGNEFYYNAGTNQLELKSAPSELRPKLQAANKTNTTGAKYVPKEQRIYESLKVPGYETPAKSDKSFAKLEADRTLEDERAKRRNARFI
tara:strand:- start:1291 stop:2133 length:843 start_codon:yes stop_codon:yes gene_type:complete